MNLDQLDWNWCETEFIDGETIKSISGCEDGSDHIDIITESGKALRLCHKQDCCESVLVEDVCGDPSDLVGAFVNSFREEFGDFGAPDYAESYTWTFYILETSKGTVTIRWLGESNGYYSESVDVFGGCVYD